MKKAYLNWSSGKDAAFALYTLQKNQAVKVEKLVTTINREIGRISMHGVRQQLLEMQARSIGLPLHQIFLKGNVSMSTYNQTMQEQVKLLKKEGFTHSVFGDIFLEDLKVYREEQLEKEDITAVFPLWKRDTRQLMQDFLDAGFKAITVCVNAKYLDESFCGRIIDREFIDSLPEGVDPCGENGEFHTFVYDGPIFKEPVKFEIGEKVQRTYQSSEKEDDNCFADKEKSWDTRFWYSDLIPV
ncbi:diphthine--ammonia ligase [Antarcticibacterium flavum]|uniref:Diphthine--ammonia ligase n=1 Tax=Antarcticibacterium flavum TaxID=2058175 RepID=A0A5B7WYL5_9FLAO|nr:MULTISPECIES: diphthine--ammonia ligase [Antarcticibacterium]MCM4161194.1 diphthine--ammonia ligase [Antarcticibacterium sp. W02-3]QCY68304.1 diphthine--ammonia ligase [Antarcticibacterium flavum]